MTTFAAIARTAAVLLPLLAACSPATEPSRPAAVTPATPAAAAAPDPVTSRQDQFIVESAAMPADEGTTFGPLEVGADWKTYLKTNPEPLPSEAHGGRKVDIYVNQVGAKTYRADDENLTVGTVLVKTSTEASGEPGATFVIKRFAPGTAPGGGEWYYAIYWENPTAAWRTRLGGPIYWRTPSKRVAYCSECH